MMRKLYVTIKWRHTSLTKQLLDKWVGFNTSFFFTLRNSQIISVMTIKKLLHIPSKFINQQRYLIINFCQK